jgi:radical SAM superfamily enzyme YgiQ (UPF0313 family)
MARVLLTSVFKPFGVDNIYSRADSKIELHHNQLSKYQGVFSMRLFFNSYGLHAIANNIDTPAAVLDFPTLDRFRKEVRKGYDIIGIGSIVPNFQKAKLMVEETRKISPRSTIVLGGFCATVPDIEKLMDVDYVCVGEGISFMRDLLGLSPEFDFKNPDVFHEDREILGMPIFGVKHPHICVGLGCSYGCDFCAPSHFFGRRHIKLIRSGRELFEEMVRVERRYGSNQISFIGDDNFFLDLKRAEELRQCVVDSGKVFSIFLFGSADKVIEFGVEKLAEMGAGVLWLGRESNFADYRKNRDINMKDLVAELHGYGIKTVLSSILLLDRHTRENIMEDIEEHLSCRPVLSQFSHYAPSPETPLYERLSEERRILTAIPFEDCHAFKQPWFIHPEFNLREAEKIQDYAYEQDFHRLGPSIMRLIDVEHRAWHNLKDSPKPILRARAEYFAGNMHKYRILLLAMEHLAPHEEMRKMTRDVRHRVESSFGPATAFEKAVARGFHLAGRVREFRTRRWGDAIQPRTRLVQYNH